MKGNKILATIIAVAMVFSAMVVINEVTDFKFVPTVGATGEVTNSGSTTGLELTCGEEITFKVVDNSLTYDEDYTLGVWNGTQWLALEDGTADYYGDISIDFIVPWWDLLNHNPITEGGDGTAGEWDVQLFTTSTEALMGPATSASDNVTLTIGNIFYVEFTEGGETIDYIEHNKSYSINNQFGVTIKNYTGASYGLGDWDDDFDGTNDPDFDYTLCLPDGTEYSTWGDTDVDLGEHEAQFLAGTDGTGYQDGSNYESFFWVNVSVNGVNNVYSNVTIPCKLNVSWYGSAPSGVVWGDDGLDVQVKVCDGNGDRINSDNNYVTNYDMAIYAPVNGGFAAVENDGVTVDGYYTKNNIDTASYKAGTWYVGTYETTQNYRIRGTEPDKPSGLPANFVPYLEFDVATYESVDVDFINSDEVISGFNQTINISVANVSGINVNTYDALTADNFHITGLKAWNMSSNVAYDDDDIVSISEFGDIVGGTYTRRTDKKAYYEFNYHFNQTGEATVIVSYPGNQTHIEGSDSYYSDTYDNEKLLPSWEGQTTFDVTSPGNLNMQVRGTMPSAVSVIADTPSNTYYNQSQSFYIDFFGSESSERVNATLRVEGCGLDFTIKQNDTVAGNDYLLGKGNGWYQVRLEPKVGGTLSLTATNGSDTDSADYSIDGLTGSVTTSVGDNLYISVKTPEKITAEVKSKGGYPIETADVYVTFYDENWANVAAVNNSDDDDLDGTDGIYEFVPDEDDIEGIGFLVCAATSGDLWMYDVIEIEPIHDINVSILNPAAAANQTLTVGIDDQTLEIQIKDPYGDIIEGSSGGSPTITGYLIDGDHSVDDPLQTLDFEQKAAQDKWILDTSGDNFPYWPGTLVIEAVNNTGENEHDGNITIPVEYATVSFSPTGAVAGIAKKNLTVEITVKDALGNPVEEGTDVYLNVNDASGTTIDASDNPVELDEDGKGEFEIDVVGNEKGSINVTFVDEYTDGNLTTGIFTIDFPDFTIVPDTISTEVNSATVTVTAKDLEGEVIPGINITFVGVAGSVVETPDPVMTDSDGQAVFDIVPLSSGKANVTIIQGLEWTSTGYTSTAVVYTDDLLTVSRLIMDATVSPTKVYAGDTFTVTVKDGDGKLIDDANVLFNGETKSTDDGVVTFTAPNPGIESYEYPIKVSKSGYPDESTTVLVINIYQIKITGPKEVESEEKFTVTVVAKGSALAGATVTFEGDTATTDNDGKATFKAPSKKGTYTVTASYEDEQYTAGTLDVKVVDASPGFELLALIVAIGVAFLLIRRRKNK